LRVIKSIADLVAFLKRFHREWLDDPSLDPALIPAKLPDGLATIYRELGALVEIENGPDNGWRAPFATQDALMPISRLKRVDGMVEFAWEDQGNWSVRSPVGQPDPPVYSNAPDVWETEQRGFVVVCESLNHFLTTLSLQEAVMSCHKLATIRTSDGPAAAVVTELHPLWVRGRYVFGEPSHDFFVCEDQDVLLMDYAGVWVGSPVRPVSDLIAPRSDYQVLSGI
jgi:hypothetical protein